MDTCLVPSSTMEASTQGGGFQGSYSSGLLGPLFKVHGIFSNIDLLFTSGGQPRTIAIFYKVWEPLEQLWTTTQKNVFTCLVLGILLDCLWPSGAASSVKTEIFHLNYLCICVYRLKCAIGIVRQLRVWILMTFRYHDCYFTFFIFFPSINNRAQEVPSFC